MSDELADLLKSVGPRRVKTPDIEVEAHDIAKLQKILDRRVGTPTFGRVHITKVVPKYNECPCTEIDDQ